MIINIGTTANLDLPIAQALASRFNGYIIWGKIDLSQIREDIIIIGGQEANQNYNWLVQQGYVPSIRSETTGFGSIFYLKLFNHNIWVMTGWSVEDTQAAGMYAINMGLPYVSRVIPLSPNKEVIQVNFPYATISGINLLDSRIGDILLQVTNKIGDYGFIDGWVDKQGKNLFILRNKIQLRLIAVADDIVVAVIIAIAAIIGLIILGVVFFVSMHEYQITERAKIRSETVEGIISNPALSEDEKTKLIKAYYSGEKKIMQQETKVYDILTIIKWSILIAAIGVGGYYLSKGIAPLIKKKEG